MRMVRMEARMMATKVTMTIDLIDVDPSTIINFVPYAASIVHMYMS